MDNFNHVQSQPFWNTIQLTPDQWKDENNKAIALSIIIEKVFRLSPSAKISPWLMHDYLCSISPYKVNKNSVGRCITNLKNDMVLIKLKDMRTGPEGKSEHFYMLNTPENNQKEHVYKKGEDTAGNIAVKMLINSN